LKKSVHDNDYPTAALKACMGIYSMLAVGASTWQLSTLEPGVGVSCKVSPRAAMRNYRVLSEL
jgi:hypothetical protein